MILLDIGSLLPTPYELESLMCFTKIAIWGFEFMLVEELWKLLSYFV